MSDRAWQELERFGPFFAILPLELDEATRPRTEWLPLDDLVEVSGRLAGRIAAVSRALAGSAPGSTPRSLADAVPAQVAVSVTQLGLTARLVAVALAAAVDRLEGLRGTELLFQDRLGGPYPLGIVARPGEPTLDAAAHWPETLLELIRPVTRLSIDLHRLSAQVAWGNVGSALASATKMITVADPVAGVRAEVLAGEAFATAELSGTGRFEDTGLFRRHSCCLIYRLAADPVFCGDCVLADRDRSRRPSRSRAASGPNTKPIVPQSNT